ncbi:hypothetical protein ALC60_14612 [Trachymyrmex zeteki]|uniref:Uncharacterized protein n=1 Tax=Mycetomoellerius zeteki TaxID=64791 RepID=A0A151WEW9_9HYME|nr:hypothetical protein ALC60_14612 [Trachymyrmex zeteki]
MSLKWLMSFKELEGQLARWVERLQQYDFQIIYRKGVLHKNANGLSRRPCANTKCQYCARIEIKEASKIGSVVARIVLSEEKLETWRQEQLEDPGISIILQGKEAGIRPSWQEVASKETSAKVYWSYWDSLEVKDGALYKVWKAPNLKSSVAQLVVPKKRVQEILKEIHDSSSGDNFYSE